MDLRPDVLNFRLFYLPQKKLSNPLTMKKLIFLILILSTGCTKEDWTPNHIFKGTMFNYKSGRASYEESARTLQTSMRLNHLPENPWRVIDIIRVHSYYGEDNPTYLCVSHTNDTVHFSAANINGNILNKELDHDQY